MGRVTILFLRHIVLASRPTAAKSSSLCRLLPTMKLNFNLPHDTLYNAVDVKSVIVPGSAGEYEVTAEHVPIVAQLKAGALTIKREDGEDEKYFVPGGFSLTHEGSTTDIVCPEAVKVDDLDPDAVAANYEAAKARVAEAEAGSAAAAEALIEVEVNKAMGGALGLAMA